MRNWLLPLLLLASLEAAGQPQSGRGVWRPVLRLSGCFMVKQDYSLIGLEAPQQQWAKQLGERAITRQLVRLCGHYSPVVRYYAFRALCRRPGAPVADVLARHLADQQRLGTFIGCLRNRQRLGDLLLWRALSLLTDSTGGPAARPLRRRLDSLLVYRPGARLAVRQLRLTRLVPPPGWHPRLRRLTARRVPGAAVALARLHQPADVPLLLRGFDHARTEDDAIQAAGLFPDPVFYPHLLRIFEREWRDEYYDYEKWHLLYQALSRYPQPQTLALFERTIQTADAFRLNCLGTFLAQALQAQPQLLFAAIRQRLEKLNLKEEDELAADSENDWP